MKDDHLVQALVNGPATAIGPLMEKYQQYVYNILSTMLTHDEAEEATQDTFIKVYKRINSYNNKSKLSTWLYTIAYRTGLDYLRKRKKTFDIDDVAIVNSNHIRTEETSTKSFETEERNKTIERLLSRLSSQDATLLKLYYLDERKLSEVAKICGLSESNTKVKLFRIRKELRSKSKHILQHN